MCICLAFEFSDGKARAFTPPGFEPWSTGYQTCNSTATPGSYGSHCAYSTLVTVIRHKFKYQQSFSRITDPIFKCRFLILTFQRLIHIKYLYLQVWLENSGTPPRCRQDSVSNVKSVAINGVLWVKFMIIIQLPSQLGQKKCSAVCELLWQDVFNCFLELESN